MVWNLIREANEQPKKLPTLCDREEESKQKKKAVEEAVTERLANNMQIARAKQIQSAVEQKTGLEVSLP